MFPPVTAYGVIRAYRYVSDDGNSYQVGVPEYLAAVGAGDLSPADPADLPFAALWQTRYLACKRNENVLGEPATGYARVPCDQFHPAYQSGPGSEVVILGSRYTVIRCVGEYRLE